MLKRQLGLARDFLRQARRLRPYQLNTLTTLQFLWRVYRPSLTDQRTRLFGFKQFQFYARPADWFALAEVILDQEYGFIRDVFKTSPPARVLDLGANIGLFSLYVLALWPSVSIFSVEPSADTYGVLDRNRVLNPSANWRTLRYAVWDRDGEVRFEDRSFSTSGRVMPLYSAGELVPAISLHTLVARHMTLPIDLLKVDIEGAEEAALCESVDVLLNVGHLIVEIHPNACSMAAVIDTLRAAYAFVYRIPGRQSAKPLLLAARQPYAFPTL